MEILIRLVFLLGISSFLFINKPLVVLQESWITGSINSQGLLLFLGSLFLLFKSTKEIREKIEDSNHDEREVKKHRKNAFISVVLHNTVIHMVFAFDAVLMAIDMHFFQSYRHTRLNDGCPNDFSTTDDFIH